MNKFLQNNGGTIMIIPGKMTEILELTGISKTIKLINSLEEGKIFARQHFPHIINFVVEKKQKEAESRVVESQDANLK